ncbi:MAG: DUF2807 domain-containing protein [bacterium]|nr:DUF2807 domain-containing protein [bacterium]
MKKLTIILIAVLASGIFLNSCERSPFCKRGKGDIVSRTITADDFTGIKLSNSFNMVISQGDVQEITAEGHENIINDLEINISGNTADFELEKKCYSKYDLTVYVTIPDLSEVKIDGSGDIEINEFLNLDNLSLSINGSGDINANGDIEVLNTTDINIDGSGNIHSQGVTGRQNIDITGSGNYSAYNVISEDCYVTIKGSGDCQVYANNLLDVYIAGSGDVHYMGNPTVDTDINGSGSVINSN